MIYWIVHNTTYLGLTAKVFQDRHIAEKFVEDMVKDIGFTDKIVMKDMTVYTEKSNNEDICVIKGEFVC